MWCAVRVGVSGSHTVTSTPDHAAAAGNEEQPLVCGPAEPQAGGRYPALGGLADPELVHEIWTWLSLKCPLKRLKAWPSLLVAAPSPFDADEPPAELILATDVEAPQSAAQVEGGSDVAHAVEVTLRIQVVETRHRARVRGTMLALAPAIADEAPAIAAGPAIDRPEEALAWP